VRPTFFVNQQRPATPEVVPNLQTALGRIKKDHRGLGGRIILQQDVAEEVPISLANVTIESEEGHRFTWKAPAKASAGKLLAIYDAPNFRMKRLALDGDSREEALINLSGNCSGTTLEDLHLKGFQKTGVWLMNCKGGAGAGRQVAVLHLDIATNRPEQSGLFFDLTDGLKARFPTNEHIVIRDCVVSGPARQKVQAKVPEAWAAVEIQDNLKPAPGK
jgi:hypothetical protein